MRDVQCPQGDRESPDGPHLRGCDQFRIPPYALCPAVEENTPALVRALGAHLQV